MATLAYLLLEGDLGVTWRELVGLVADGTIDPCDVSVYVDHEDDD